MEDYYFDIDERVTEGKVFVLVIYDITENRRRTKLVKFLRGYGFRVQKSAFEAVIGVGLYRKMIAEIGQYAAPEDSIRVYRIIGKGQVRNFGKSIEVWDEETIII